MTVVFDFFGKIPYSPTFIFQNEFLSVGYVHRFGKIIIMYITYYIQLQRCKYIEIFFAMLASINLKIDNEQVILQLIQALNYAQKRRINLIFTLTLSFEEISLYVNGILVFRYCHTNFFMYLVPNMFSYSLVKVHVLSDTKCMIVFI